MIVHLLLRYISQIESGKPNNDCGPACIIMLLYAYLKAVTQTIDGLYAAYGLPDEGLAVSTIAAILADQGVPNERDTGSLPDLRQWIDERRPPVLLIDYSPIHEASLNQIEYHGGHYVVVTGYDAGGFTVHDPYGWGTSLAHKYWPNAVMDDAWGTHGQYNYTAIVPAGGIELYSDPVQEDEMAGYREYLEQIQSLVEEALGPVAEPAPEMDVYQVTATDGLYLRQGPGQNYQSIRLMDYGEKVDLVSTDHAPWYQVQAKKDYANGYAHMNWLKGPLA